MYKSLAKQCAISSCTSLLSHKMRSFLTMLGIIIGVSAVIVIIALGAGAQSLILTQMESLGSNKIGIIPGKANDHEPPASAMGIIITTLTHDDIKAIKEKIPKVTSAVAYVNDVAVAIWGSHSYGTNLKGTMTDYLEVEDVEMESGRFFSSGEEEDLSRVAVLGYTVKKELFGETDAVGKKIKIKKNIFEVIGVTKERGTVAFQNHDDQILIPIKTMQKIIMGINYVNMARVAIDSEDNIHEAQEGIEMLLRDRHDLDDPTGDSDDFTVRNSADALDMITTITDALRLFLAAMAGLSLLVGGIGIMNIMLVRVAERTREIGLRKAIGASNGNIIMQFLIETIAITTIGGIIGMILGIIISFLITLVIKKLGYDWKFSVSLFSILLSVGVSMAIGLIFGIYPARKASKLSPVEALRYE